MKGGQIIHDPHNIPSVRREFLQALRRSFRVLQRRGSDRMKKQIELQLRVDRQEQHLHRLLIAMRNSTNKGSYYTLVIDILSITTNIRQPIA